METFVFVTNNQHKLEEAKAMLKNKINIVGLSGIGCYDNIPETGKTLKENALQKAHFIYDNYHYNCFADDTGLEIDTLGGRPGVFSARYAGENKSFDDNIRKVIYEMKGKTNRRARFRTVISLIIQGKEYFFEGIVEGKIIENKRGNMGFGYDPIFIPNGYSRTFAQMDEAEKNHISHRGIALRKMAEFLEYKKIFEQ